MGRVGGKSIGERRSGDRVFVGGSGTGRPETSRLFEPRKGGLLGSMKILRLLIFR
jgi:hypothetical protein